MSTSELMPVAKPAEVRIAGRAQHADEAAAEVAEEIPPVVFGREVRGHGSIESCADDRAARAGIRVGVNRIAHARLTPGGLGPSVCGQPKFAPAIAWFTSSQVSWPTSLRWMRPLVRSTAKLKGLRRPRPQIAWLMPDV